jgi:Cytochrome c oxidase subunit IIa family
MPTVDDDAYEGEPRPRGALLLILVYLVILAVFWINTYLRIWRS